jgi:sugar phosphate isomerase/epimerase
MKLGVDVYSLRLYDWDVFQQLEYAHQLGLDVLHTGLHAFESTEEDYLRRVRGRAEELGVELEVGMGCICPTSATFAQSGTGLPFGRGRHVDDAQVVVEHLRRMLHIADTVGSSTVHCYLGHKWDRQTEIPIAAHIESTVNTCRAVRDLALELGITIAIENHAGDLQGRELKALIEEAGPEYVGACLDSGGTLCLAAESPFVTLEHLAPYVVQSHIRDTALWEHPRGAAVQSVVMGEGTIGIDEWARLFQARCTRSSFTLENITGSPPQVLEYLDPEFWEVYPDTLASEFAQFLQLVRQGYPYMGPMLTVQGGWRSPDLPPEYLAAMTLQQRLDFERSVRYCQEVLKLGEWG